MLSKEFFRKLAFNVVKKYKRHIWKGSKDVYGKNFRQYSTTYGKRKRLGDFKRQSAESRNKTAPILTGDLKNDFKLLKSSMFGFSIGWASQGAKVKWLKKNKRIITEDSQPLPKGLLRMIDKAIKTETEGQLPKDEVIRIGK
tara:strand:- start:133 stop:558 length:426 start_codon:yes stop_codon:yes gene_type:complete